MFSENSFNKGLKSFGIGFAIIILGYFLRVSGVIGLIIALLSLIILVFSTIFFIASVVKERAKLKFFSVVMILFIGYISLLVSIGIRDSLK